MASKVIERSYAGVGQDLTVRYVEGVVAVRIAQDEQGRAARPGKDFGRVIGRSQADQALQINQNGRAAFEGEGWVFVEPKPEVERSLRDRQLPDGSEDVLSVCLDEGGRPKLLMTRIVVQLHDDLSEESAVRWLARRSGEFANTLRFAANLFEVEVPVGIDPIDFANDLHSRDEVVFAEPQFLEHIPGRWTPTDPDFGDQWQWRNTGADGGTAGADVSAEEAWDITRGNGMRIAVIDGGIDVDHDDLGAAVAGGGWFGNDAMGNLVFNLGTAGFPDGDHGTFCAGMALARANNAAGGCGIAPDATLIPIAGTLNVIGTQAGLARAVAFAADPTTEGGVGAGADVISCSQGPNGGAWLLTNVLNAAINNVVANGRGGLGCPIFWAVDNTNQAINLDQVCSHPSVIAVGRSTRTDIEDNSAFGPELEFLAPGVDVYSTSGGNTYDTDTGTSYAAPTAAGLGGLVLSMDASLTWQAVRQAIRDTCDQVGGVAYPGGRNNDYGFGRINAHEAVCEAGRRIELVTTSITFNDVVAGTTTGRAIRFDVQACRALNFQITAGPSSAGFAATVASASSTGDATLATEETLLLWLTYQAGAAGTSSNDQVTVTCSQTGDAWTIPVIANVVAAPTAACALVLDQSGSMDWDAGGGVKRVDLLRVAGVDFMTAAPEGTGVGVCSFDDDAHAGLPVAALGGATGFDPARTDRTAQITGHTPNTGAGGGTSVGDGVTLGRALLNGTSGFDHKSMIVFTDGQENEPAWLDDVASSIDDRVFAIGLGTAQQIDPVALSKLTDDSGGYLLLTGPVDANDHFRLRKYFLQVLAGVTNAEVVLDPEGWVHYGQIARVPFDLSDTDYQADVYALTNSRYTVLGLEAPDGTVVGPHASIPGVEYVHGPTCQYYRLGLPAAIGSGAHAGRWHALLAMGTSGEMSKVDHAYLKDLKAVDRPSSRYSVNVHSRSNLRLEVSTAQTSREPGGTAQIRAVLTEYGIPVDGRATVRLERTRPDGTTVSSQLAETQPGVFETTFVGIDAGVHHCRVMAKGKTLRAQVFTREQLRSVAFWRGGEQPAPSSDNQHADPKETLCRLLECLRESDAIRPELANRLGAAGFDLEALERCLCDKASAAPMGIELLGTLQNLLVALKK